MNPTDTTQPSSRPLRNVDLCRRVSAFRSQPPIAAQPIFPDADAVPAAVNADAGLRQLFRRPVTVPWLEQTEAFRTLAE
ncbi:MAG: hypothetical protein ACKODH_09165 [Limisphaerales bacterium]